MKSLGKNLIKIWSILLLFSALASAKEPLVLASSSTWPANADVYALAFSSDSQNVLSGDDARYLSLWNVETGSRTAHWLEQADVITSVALSNNGKLAISASQNGHIILRDSRDLSAAEPLAKDSPHGHNPIIALTRDGKTAISGGEDGTIALWDIEKSVKAGRFSENFPGRRNELPRRALPENKTIHALALSPITNIALIGSDNDSNGNNLWSVEVSTNPKKSSWSGLPPHPVTAIAFSHDGKKAMTGDSDGNLALWDVAKGKLIGDIWDGHKKSINAVAFSPDGKTALSTSDSAVNEGTIKLWNLSSKERELLAVLKDAGPSASAYAVAFSPNGKYAISGSGDKTIKLWDMAAIKKALEGPAKANP